MTSEGEANKTSEFLRRRKLRLQQVREQSKDIAKIIRQRAKVEKLRQVVDLDASKEKDYLQRQEKVVKKLEQLYSKGLQHLGTGHKDASGVSQAGQVLEKTDLSRLRGKEAAAELKRNKQQKLDEQKKSLDRKIQAREAANLISREKSATTVNKLSTKSSSSKLAEESKTDKVGAADKSASDDFGDHDGNKKVTRSDMATQWDAGILPNEWEPNIPALAIPKDDSNKESLSIDTESNIDKKKRPNLFALSDEMPSSLRGNYHPSPSVNESSKPSLTLVSEYIQNRALRLRETSVINSSKKQSQDLHNLKQTILRTRSSRTEGSAFSNICHVLEGQVIPVPTWRAEASCQYCSPSISPHKQNSNETRQFANVTNSQINKIFCSIRPRQLELVQSPVIQRKKPFKNKYSEVPSRSVMQNDERSLRGNSSENGFTKKKSVTMYNHSTRDSRDVPFVEEPVVTRDMHSDKDAYSEALNEAASCSQETQSKKVQEMNNKIAMTRQNVEKEFKDTMAFLNGLPKNKGLATKPLKNAYKDDYRMDQQKESRQRILQQEFKNMEREVGPQNNLGRKSTLPARKPRRSKSPKTVNADDQFNERDFQYSWMPVPERDGNLAVHTIPTTVKEGKSGNTVKFSKVDSYHEYRSRHKHTPPTKDTSSHDKKPNKRVVEAVIIQQNDGDSSSNLSTASDDSSSEHVTCESNVNKNTDDNKLNKDLTDAERIIIYKILDHKSKKNDKATKKLKEDAMIQSSKGIENEKTKNCTDGDNISKTDKQCIKTNRALADDENQASADELCEGVYKSDAEKGDNISTMYFSKNLPEGEKKGSMDSSRITCSCNDNLNSEKQFREGPNCKSNRSDDIDIQESRKDGVAQKCKCFNRSRSKCPDPTIHHPFTNASATSFQTATNVKTNNTSQEGEYIKLNDEGVKEKGNFYIGATGFLKDDAYEVVIQLRKKDVNKNDPKKHEEEVVTKEKSASDNEDNHIKKNDACSSESKENIYQKATNEHCSEPTVTNNPQIYTIKNQNPVIDSNTTTTNLAVNIDNREQYPQNRKTSDAIPSATTQYVFTKHDRGVTTPFRDTYSIPSHVPKTDPISRQATSSYTQTTLSPPDPRPVFVHMSSSTSTAYMSPPEVVLPHFFRRGYESCSEAYQNVDLQDERRMYSEQQPHCENRSRCRCRRCLRAEHVYQSKTLGDMKVNQLKTPPNTGRSFVTDVRYESVNTNRAKGGTTYSSPVSSRQNKRCHNCKIKRHSKLCCKNHSHRNKYQVLPVRSTRSAALNNRKSKINLNGDKNNSQSYLNPLIKDYIKKLLSLNREGIKAIQIMNQECSSVNTPASSIINESCNAGSHKPNIDVVKSHISLEQIKNIFKQQLLDDHTLQHGFQRYCGPCDSKAKNVIHKNTKTRRRNLKKKTFHKVKSLNISKKILINSCQAYSNSSPATLTETSKDIKQNIPINLRSRSQSLALMDHIESNKDFITDYPDEIGSKNKISKSQNKHPTTKSYEHRLKNQFPCEDTSSERQKKVIYSGSSSPESRITNTLNENRTRQPINTSTQTTCTIDDEMNFMKLAEDKLHNMEKIADLTEKCTKRLSNLAKVLEEVRKNKSLAYSHVSTSDSIDSDQRSDKLIVVEKTEQKSPNFMLHVKDKATDTGKESASSNYESLLIGIPKPGCIKSPLSTDSENGFYNKNNEATSKTSSLVSTNAEYGKNNNTKFRSKPPPALLRMHLKRPEEHVVPHELSTVIEVDSPLSVKLKNQSSNTDNANQSHKFFTESRGEEESDRNYDDDGNKIPTLRQSDVGVSNYSKIKIISTDSSDDSKLQMMDLNQFNDIMLRPFISLQEYAQEYYGDDTVLKRESIPKNTGLVDDVSSLQSDGSLPDVVAELLKRKLIAEPFKFDTASNINSTTVSSESTLSVLALSKERRNKTKSKIIENKENVAETSDSLSISSNPDLENAFKKLGMGWASSTLKKTKERLALSSSSNTSSSSLSQYKFKNSNKQEMPTIVTDSVSSVPNLSKKLVPERHMDGSKNAQQQTSLTNSMTVKEFLNNELANKITFMNKSVRNDSNEEFVSLIETKIPEELKDSSKTMIEENSGDSVRSGNNNRARTSTPVQIFKSVTYHSSSSSNISNGLFSNADDLSSVKLTSTSMRYHSTSEKDELTVPNCSLKMRKGVSDGSKTDSC